MTERNFDFLMPSVNFFGPGVISKIGERAKTLGMHKPVIVTDKFLESLPDGAVAQVRRSLDAAGIDYVIYNQVEPNPKIHNIQAVKALYQANQADSLITIGVDLGNLLGLAKLLGGLGGDCGLWSKTSSHVNDDPEDTTSQN